jgi:pimeloyl-ACP methyl ester carboxylesterase
MFNDNPSSPPTPKSGYVQVGACRLHFLSAGSGRPVVLLHGLGGMAQEVLAPLLKPAVRQRWRLIAFDRPGYGFSDPPPDDCVTPSGQARLIHGALERMGVERPVLVAHSLGAAVALAYAVRFPNEISGLVLLGGFFMPMPEAPMPLLRLATAPVIGPPFRRHVLRRLVRWIAPRKLKALFAPNLVPQSFRRFPLGLATRPNAIEAMARDLRSFNRCMTGLVREFPRIDRPLIILAGVDDPIVPAAEQSCLLHKAVPGSELRLLAGVGHMPHHVCAEAVVEAIADAWARGALEKIAAE